MENTIPQSEDRMTPPTQMFVSGDMEVIPHNKVGAAELATPSYWIDTPEKGGVLSYEIGSKFPRKAWPFCEAVYAVDTIKRVIINAARLAGSSPFVYIFSLFLLLPDSVKRDAIKKVVMEFADYTVIVFDRWGRMLQYKTQEGISFGLQGVIWKPNYFCDMVREFRRVAFEMWGEEYTTFINAICMIFEFDDAYRYRIQDLFGEIDKNAVIANPGKEIARVLKLGMERGEGTSKKFGYILKLAPAIFMIKCIREGTIEFFSKINLKEMSLDEMDEYRCMFWGGYKFKGIPDEERASTRIMIDALWKVEQDKKKEELKKKKEEEEKNKPQ